MNSLQIELIEKIDYGYLDCMWVRLTCGSESRKVCFEPCTDGRWAYLDGDCEPLMPDDVQKAWEGDEGDEALTGLWNGDFTHTEIE